MLNKLKHISSVVLFLFLGASLLQSTIPLLMQQMSAHHGGEKMACSIDGNCSESCSLDGEKTCSCNHGTSNDVSTDAILCDCDQHGNKTTGPHTPFQIKAPLVSAFDGITLASTSIFLTLYQPHLFIITDDIFHPPA